MYNTVQNKRCRSTCENAKINIHLKAACSSVPFLGALTMIQFSTFTTSFDTIVNLMQWLALKNAQPLLTQPGVIINSLMYKLKIPTQDNTILVIASVFFLLQYSEN